MSIQEMYKKVFIQVYFDGNTSHYNSARKYSMASVKRLWESYIENLHNKGAITRAEKEQLIVEV